MQFQDAATWGELKAMKQRIEKQDLKIAAITDWLLLDGTTKKKWVKQEGKTMPVLVKFTFQKTLIQSEEEPDG